MNLTLATTAETEIKHRLRVPENAVVVGEFHTNAWETWQQVNFRVLDEQSADLLVQGYRELSQDDYLMAEADMAAGLDTLPYD